MNDFGAGDNGCDFQVEGHPRQLEVYCRDRPRERFTIAGPAERPESLADRLLLSKNLIVTFHSRAG